MRHTIWSSMVLLLIIAIVAGGCMSMSSSSFSHSNETQQTEEQGGLGQAGESDSDESAPVEEPAEPAPFDPVAELLDELTIEEKIGQLLLVGMDGTAVNSQTRELINTYHVGGFIFYKDNIQNSEQALSLFNQLHKDNAKAKVPLFLSIDEEGGRVTRMPNEFLRVPSAMKIANTGIVDAATEFGVSIGVKLNAFGINMDFAPVLDINSNPDNPVIGDRSFGHEAELVSNMGVAMMKGIREQGVIPVVKHFPGHGDTSVDSHLGLPIVEHDIDRLRKLELQPFKAAISEGADVVMMGHILLPQLDPAYPASFSQMIIQDLLRKELGFEGVVMTDDMTMGAITENYSMEEAAVQFIQAGGNIVLVGHDFSKAKAVIEAVTKAVLEGEISEEVLNERVYTVLRLKEKYKLSDKPAKGPDLKALNKQLQELLNKYGMK